MKLIADVETNGFLDKLDTVHCIVCKDIETGKVYEFNPDNLEQGLQLIKKATLLIGHSVLGFDIPALASTGGRGWLGVVCILGNISLIGLELAIFSNWRWVAGTEEMCEPSALGISNASRGFCADSCSINSFSSILLS